MPETATSSEIKLFADGSLLYCTIDNQTDSHLLQSGLTILEDWKNKLHGHTLDNVEASKYLGVTINNNLSLAKETRR
jgi:hypothetical protein